jgi:hypothetical protein
MINEAKQLTGTMISTMHTVTTTMQLVRKNVSIGKKSRQALKLCTLPNVKIQTRHGCLYSKRLMRRSMAITTLFKGVIVVKLSKT